MIKLVDQEDLRKEREGKLALEEKKAGGQLHSNSRRAADKHNKFP